MRIPTDPRLPRSGDVPALITRLYDLWRPMASQINNFVEGRISAATNASSSAPTSGMYQQGDFVRNSAPAELGSGGSKYVIEGWLCTVGGEPGTFVEKRFLTGN